MDAVDLAAPAVVGVLLGLLAATLAFLLTAPKLPLLAGVAAPPPDLGPSIGVLVLVGSTGALVVGVVAALGGAVAGRRLR